jgi:hypothetical protein
VLALTGLSKRLTGAPVFYACGGVGCGSGARRHCCCSRPQTLPHRCGAAQAGLPCTSSLVVLVLCTVLTVLMTENKDAVLRVLS